MAHTWEWVVVATRPVSTSWRPNVAFFGPSTGSRPIIPDCETATTHGSSSRAASSSAATSASVTSLSSLGSMIRLRRSTP